MSAAEIFAFAQDEGHVSRVCQLRRRAMGPCLRRDWRLTDGRSVGSVSGPQGFVAGRGAIIRSGGSNEGGEGHGSGGGRAVPAAAMTA